LIPASKAGALWRTRAFQIVPVDAKKYVMWVLSEEVVNFRNGSMVSKKQGLRRPANRDSGG
jgi:hypothetical protein